MIPSGKVDGKKETMGNISYLEPNTMKIRALKKIY
jgi:hypothetical protein